MGGLNFIRDAKKLLNRLAQENKCVKKQEQLNPNPKKSKENNAEVLLV